METNTSNITAMPNIEDDEVEIDVKELLLELLDHWKLLISSTILVAAIAFIISEFLIVPSYESTASLYVLSKSTSLTSLSDLQLGTSLTNDYLVVVQGRPVLEQVIKNLNLNTTYQELSDKVSIENPDDSRILEITVTDSNPSTAKIIADEIAEVGSEYIAEKMDQDPPTIIQYGYTDGNPVSPSVGKNTLIGAAVGFLLAGALVVVFYLLNDTIMDADDLEKKVGLHSLGVLPFEEILDETHDDGSLDKDIEKYNKGGKSGKHHKHKSHKETKNSETA